MSQFLHRTLSFPSGFTRLLPENSCIQESKLRTLWTWLLPCFVPDTLVSTPQGRAQIGGYLTYTQVNRVNSCSTRENSDCEPKQWLLTGVVPECIILFSCVYSESQRNWVLWRSFHLECRWLAVFRHNIKKKHKCLWEGPPPNSLHNAVTISPLCDLWKLLLESGAFRQSFLCVILEER